MHRIRILGASFVLALLVVQSASAARLTAADRKAIDHAVDVFVNHAVKRANVGAAYAVVDSNLRGGMTRRQWSHGEIAVYTYPARGTPHPCTVDYVDGNEAGAEVMMQREKGGQLAGASRFM